MKKFLVITWFIASVIPRLAADSASPPHIVFIMADDMGWDDVSYHGSDQIQTPNIDVLASKSVVLQQYYAEAICTPSRTALLTGKYPMRMAMHGTPLDNAEDRGIPATEKLLPSYLKDLGYATHLVGKWHVGMSREEFLPVNRGFDTHYGIRGGFVDFYTYNKVETWSNGTELCGLDLFDDNSPQNSEQRYVTDLFTERAKSIIDSHNESTPLYLQLNYNAPHAGNDGGLLQPPLGNNVGSMHIAHSDRRLYAELVKSLDTNIGEVIRALADKNILNDTIIVFVSDNGAPTVGLFQNWGINLPLRGIKWTPWEGAVRVPAMIWHPSLKPRIWNGLMHITDWLPTLMEAAGGSVDDVIDGVSQWQGIKEDADSNRTEFLVAIENSDGYVYAAYRSGDYKIIVGNVTDKSNDYYGANLLATKGEVPDYHEAIQNCEVADVLESYGYPLDIDQVDYLRNATLIVQIDTTTDETPCVPSADKGCLYNVVEDPTESHDLWDNATDIAEALNATLQVLWSEQMVRGIRKHELAGDPANFNYTWWPWY